MAEWIDDLISTDMTKTTHRDTYPAISPSRPESNQKGRTVLVTGGGTGIGLAIAQSFVQASADIVIVIGRRSDVLVAAKSTLEEKAKTTGTNTKIITHACDITNLTHINALWKTLETQGITVDVYVSNAAKFSDPKTIFELGADEVWSQVEVNAKGPLYFAEKFYSQQGDKQKFIVNVSTQAVSMTGNSGVAARPAYTLSKAAGALLFQVIAQNVSPKTLQIVNFHPGCVYTEPWKKLNVSPGMFDSEQLGADFAVWATTKEAEFLHGRSVWASWDVEELSTGELRKRFDEDFYFLRVSVAGMRGAFKH